MLFSNLFSKKETTPNPTPIHKALWQFAPELLLTNLTIWILGAGAIWSFGAISHSGALGFEIVGLPVGIAVLWATAKSLQLARANVDVE